MDAVREVKLALLRFAGWAQGGQWSPMGQGKHYPTVPVRQRAVLGRFHGYSVEALLDDREYLPFGVEDTMVSRKHAAVFWQGEQLLVQDLGSLNGTRINGHPIPSKRRQESEPVPFPGDEGELALGRVLLHVTIVKPQSLGPGVTQPLWDTLLTTTTGRGLSDLLSNRIRPGASEQERGLTLFLHLLDALAQHPQVHPALIFVLLQIAYPHEPFIKEMFQWFQAQNLTPEQIAVLKDPSLLLEMVKAKLPLVQEVLAKAPPEALTTTQRLRHYLASVLEGKPAEGR